MFSNFSIPSLALLLVACRSDKGVTVFNPNPEAEITSHSNGDEVLEGAVITFEGHVGDANHDAEQLTVEWKKGTQSLCEAVPPASDGFTSCSAVLSPQDTEVTLKVIDVDGGIGTAMVTLEVVPSQEPSCSISTPLQEGIYYSDQLITFSGTITDEEDNPELLTGYWESNVDGILSDVDVTPSSSGAVQGYSLLSQGQHAIELHGEDTTGKTCLSSVIIDVGPPNSTPSCEILTPLDGSAGPEGDTVIFTASADDVDIPEDMLSATWSSDKDSELGIPPVNSDGSISFPYSSLSVDTHLITLTVADEVGATCTSSIIYTVGTPPSITIESPSDGDIINEGEVISFAATVSDAQDQSDEISLDWSLNGTSISTQGATSSGTAEFSDATLTYGSYNLVVTAIDTDGLTDSDQINFTINGIPSQPDISITPDPAYTNDVLSVVIDTDSVDPEGTSVNYTYEWLLEGNVQSAYTSSSLPSSATNKGEEWTVRVTPDDGMVSGEAGTATITISNTAPVLSGISISPNSNVYLDTTLICSVTVTDPDETPIPSFEWSVGSTSIGSGATLDLSTVGVSPADVVTCTALVVDGDGESATDSINVTVENRLPVVDSVTLSPSTVYTNDVITAIAVFSDDDSMQTVSATYAWHVIDAATGTDTEVQSGNNSTLSGVTFFDRDDEVYVIVTPNDGFDDGASVTSSILTISNTAPTALAVSMTPDPAVEGQDDLVCSVDTPSSDDDGDAVVYTYVWTDDSGTVQQTTTEVSTESDTFTASGTTEGTWTCEVTPFDGTDYGAVATATVNVNDGCWSLYFDGANDYIDTPLNPFSNTQVEEGTLTAWIRTTDTGTGSFVNLEGWVIIALNAGHKAAGCSDGVCTSPEGYTVINDDRWYHLTVSWNSNTTKLFVNGVLESEVVSTKSPLVENTDRTLRIGGHANPTKNGFIDSHITKMKLWSSELTATEIEEDFLGTLQNVPDLADFRLNQGYGTSVVSEVDGLTGIISGAYWTQTCPEEDLDGDGVAAWEDCDDSDSSITTGPNGASSSCPGIDCAHILEDGYSTGDGNYWIDPQSDGSAYEVYCLMDSTYDGGGWTLISTHSDDGQDTWTWNNRHYFDTDTTTFGSLSATNEDYKSMALHDVGMQDLLFVHAPSGIWAGYNDLDNGSNDFGSLVADIGGPNVNALGGYPLSAGTLYIDNYLNETSLYFNVIDGDGTGNNSYGPTWNCTMNNSVNFDDPDACGLGPTASESFEVNHFANGTYFTGIYGLGYGFALEVNTGSSAAAENYMQVFVRRDYTDADGDGVAAWEDCDDSDASISASESGGSENCAATSCKTILDDGYSTGDGTYWIDPDGSGAFEVYCDMTTDGGGWSLLSQGGQPCASRTFSYSLMFESVNMTSTDLCSYLPYSSVSALANSGATEIMLNVGNTFGSWTSTARSLDGLAITALQSSTGTWHNGASWDNWYWCPNCTSTQAYGWPDMFHSSGSCSGVHWWAYDGQGRVCDPSEQVTATWIR